MKKPITVKILVTVPDMESFDACTLCFESLHVGWPTADIHIYVNGFEFYQKVLQAIPDRDWCLHGPLEKVHLADWIREQVNQEYPGPLVICDADTVFWKSCEDWQFEDDVLLAGYYVPRMWNDFSKCISVPRIHTSMMVFPDTRALAGAIAEAYPWALEKHSEYCPCGPFLPAVRFSESGPVYWDCCANLYNMLMSIGGGSIIHEGIEHFGPEHLACFDHLNSASFYEVMCERLEGSYMHGFKAAHSTWVKNPTPGLWPLVDEYYRQKEIEGRIKL